MKLNPTIQTGLIIEVKPEDFVLGASSIPFERRNTTKDWRQFRSRPERQRYARFDAMNCVSQTSTNLWEAQANFLLVNNLWPKESLEFFNKNGYIVDGKFEISERFQAKVSNTTTSGNSYQRVLDTMRHDSANGKGVVPEALWPSTLNPDIDKIDWAAYYKTPSQEVFDLAKQSLEHFKFPYEAIHYGTQTDTLNIIKKALEHAPLGLAVATCQPWDGSVSVCSLPPNHAVTNDAFTTSYIIWDSYDPHEKYLEPGYLIHYVVKAVLSPLKKKEQSTNELNDGLFHHDIVFTQTGLEVGRLRRALSSLGFGNNVEKNLYDSELAGAVFKFQLKYLADTWLEMILNLKGRRVGPRTRAVLNRLQLFWK